MLLLRDELIAAARAMIRERLSGSQTEVFVQEEEQRRVDQQQGGVLSGAEDTWAIVDIRRRAHEKNGGRLI